MSKRPAESSAEFPVPKSRVLKKSQAVPAAPGKEATGRADAAAHPTMKALTDIMEDKDFSAWLSEQGKAAISFGGLEPLDSDKFRNSMKDSEYMCTVHSTAIAATALTHAHLVPSMASIARLMDVVWNRDSAARGGRVQH